MKRIIVLIIMLFSLNLYAVPGFIVHQGYIEDSNGNPYNGVLTMTIGIYGSPDGDDILFEQAVNVAVSEGFYVTEIDDGAIMPVFDVDKTLYLEISIDGKKGTPRQKIGSVPYAFYAAKAYDVIGDIHPNSIFVNGIKVIDETGKYTGPIDAVTSITAGDGLAGGTITSTGTISLLPGYVDGSVYDNRFVNENQSDSISTDMLQDNSITGDKLANGAIGLNHLNNNGCTDGQIMKYSASSGWQCATDLNNSYQAGNGLVLTGNTFSANFAGTGTANTVARSDHNHNGVYAPYSHNHDDAYVKIKGDTMYGKLGIEIDSAVDTPVALTTKNGSILFEGPDGITPTRGAGIRLMWIPSKVAFRAGAVNGDQWDDTYIGKTSFAFGENVLVDGEHSFGVGSDNNVSGAYNFIFGNNTKSTGSMVFAVGDHNQIPADEAYILGSENSINGSYLYSIGFMNQTDYSLHSYLIGRENGISQSTDAVAIGRNISISNASDAVAIGSYISVSAKNSVTIGKGDDNSAIGGPLTNSISDSFMVGFNSTVPTLFVSGASGGTSTGNVGIGNTDPQSKLDIAGGGVRTRISTTKVDDYSPSSTQTYVLKNPEIPCSETNGGEIRVLFVDNGLSNPFQALCACMTITNTLKYAWHCFK